MRAHVESRRMEYNLEFRGARKLVGMVLCAIQVEAAVKWAERRGSLMKPHKNV